jgi:hypothetical protein
MGRCVTLQMDDSESGTDRGHQIWSEFLIESIMVLERLANEKNPPMKLAVIESKRSEFNMANEDDDTTDLGNSLAEMKAAFRGQGDVSLWDPEVLTKIDRCFVKNYGDQGALANTLFFPSNADNENRFQKYCSDVDLVLKEAGSKAPKYSREYFAFYSIWQFQGFRFPMPIGTASVLEALNTILTKYSEGLSEVSVVLVCFNITVTQ